METHADCSVKFQSSSGPSTGCNKGKFCLVEIVHPVSILIRPFDRMQPDIRASAASRPLRFQSSSGPSTGCNLLGPAVLVVEEAVSILIRPFDRMQLGVGVGEHVGVEVVSILIRPFDRMQRGWSAADYPRGGIVSILIRPFDRMQPGSSEMLSNIPDTFQSSSGPFDRMQQPICSGGALRHSCFNPHPALRPDATRTPCADWTLGKMFQSSSGPSTGCNASRSI